MRNEGVDYTGVGITKHITLMLILGIVLGVLAFPGASEAQQSGKVYRIGYLSISAGAHEQDSHYCPITGSETWQAIVGGLRDYRYVRGQNLIIECRWTGDVDERARPLATEIVNLKPDLIIAAGTGQVRAIKQATSTIPVVMVGVIDPVGRGLVKSLAKPGGNVTGFTETLIEMEAKRLQLLKDVAPSITRVAILGRKDRPWEPIWIEQYETAARALGLKLQKYLANGPEDLPDAFAAMSAAREEGLLVVPTGRFEIGDTVKKIAELAMVNKLPSSFQGRFYLEAGGLMSYTVDEVAIRRRVGGYVDKILNGANPGDLPVEQPSKFNLVINLKTAHALGLSLPPTLLMLADEVIN